MNDLFEYETGLEGDNDKTSRRATSDPPNSNEWIILIKSVDDQEDNIAPLAHSTDWVLDKLIPSRSKICQKLIKLEVVDY